MRTWRRRIAELLLVACPGICAAYTHDQGALPRACGVRAPGDSTPRIGLALGGGGARGIAHISVLEKLEELKVPVDCIAGTSMGSLVGGLYASGASVEHLRSLVLTTDWKRLFDDSIDRQQRSFRRKQDDRERLATLGVGITSDGIQLSPGLLQGERVLSLFERETLHVSHIRDFDRLPVPFRAVATDLNTGTAVVLSHGSLARAMRASMSLPGVFQPFEIDGTTLVDGGLADQVPIDVVRAMGADIVIAVDVGTPMAHLDQDSSLLEVVSQLTGMLTTGNTARMTATLAAPDVLIVPKLGSHVSTGDFTKAREALQIGKAAADGATALLAALSNAPAFFATAREATASPTTSPIVDFVRIENQTSYSDEVLLSLIDIPTGSTLDSDAAETGVLRAYALGTMSSVTYDVVEEDGRTGVLVRARSKPEGPAYVQAGFALSSDFSGSFNAGITGAMLFSPLSPRGAEARIRATFGNEPSLIGEYYYPVDTAGRYVLSTKGGYTDSNIHVIDEDGHDVAMYDVERLGVQLQAARELSNVGEIAIGYLRSTGKARVEVGAPSLGSIDFNEGQLFTRFSVDQLDSLFFPRDGLFGEVGYTASRAGMGADSDFDKLDVDAIVARSFGRQAIQFGARYHTTLSGTLPIQSLYRLGGPTRLVGFEYNQLTGQNYGVLFAGYSYQLARILGRSALLGGTVEYGNAWQRRRDMGIDDGIWNGGVYVGFDSWLGPVLFGIGVREGGASAVYLEVGRPY